MGHSVSCARCGGRVRPPGLAHSGWRCDACGPATPLYVARRINAEIVAATVTQARRVGVPVWCLWPLPPGWMVTGLAWAGDGQSTAQPNLVATAIMFTGPTPLGLGPADVVLVAEEPGVGLGARLAGIPGPDPGPELAGQGRGLAESHAKVKVGGHPTPLWSMSAPSDRSAYAGEAKGRWLYAVAWPADAGYLLADMVALHDLADWLPQELVFGAPSPRWTSSD